MTHLKLLIFVLLILIGCGSGISTHAEGNKKIGDACSDNTECQSNECEDSFCTCGDTVPSNSCAFTYGGTAADWRCVDNDEDPVSERGEWNFCVKNTYVSSFPKTSTEEVRYPLDQKLLMGQPCNATDACLSGNGHLIDICNETNIPSEPSQSNPHYDPWYTDGRKLNVCTPPHNFNAPDICEYQYGDGDWRWAVGTGELTGIGVCQKDGALPITTLAQMKKNSIKDSTGIPVEIFGFDTTLPEPKFSSPTPKIKIPGVVFSSISKESNVTTDESGASWLNIPFLGEYISSIYKYSVGLISLIAVMVMIISGVQIITSAGNSEAISGAKHRIISSVIAIALTAGSYTILYTINPELVNLRNLKILLVSGNTNLLGPTPEEEASTQEDSAEASVTAPSFLPTDPIRIKNSERPYYLANCSAFPDYTLRDIPKGNDPTKKGAKARKECRLACIAQLPEEWKSKIADSRYQTKYLGAMDCNAQEIRSLKSIKFIAIHEGGPGGISTWWDSNVFKQLPTGSHYFVTSAGIIYQIADERFEMWHGVENATSIGIDLSIVSLDETVVTNSECASGKALPQQKRVKCGYTEAQYQALNTLIVGIRNRIITAGGSSPKLKGHCEHPGSDHVDPRNFDWSKIGETNAEHQNLRCLPLP